MSNELTNRPKETFSLTPKSLDEAMKYAEMMAKSTIVPKGYQGKPGDILVAVQMGAELGLKPIQSLQNIAVINGKPSIYGDACIALVQSHPEFEDINEYFDEKLQAAVCEIKRRGKTKQVSTFSIEDAKKAGLWNKSGPWMQYPKRMLQMRARGFCLRNTFADALLGLILAEEAMDYKDVTSTVFGGDSTSSSTTDRILSKLTSEPKVEETKVEEPQPELSVDAEIVEEAPLPSLAEQLTLLIFEKNVPLEVTRKWLEKADAMKFADLSDDELQKCIMHVHSKY